MNYGASLAVNYSCFVESDRLVQFGSNIIVRKTSTMRVYHRASGRKESQSKIGYVFSDLHVYDSLTSDWTSVGNANKRLREDAHLKEGVPTAVMGRGEKIPLQRGSIHAMGYPDKYLRLKTGWESARSKGTVPRNR